MRNAAITGINSGWTRYTATGGAPSLKEAICLKLKRDHGLVYRPDEVMASVGGKQALYNAIQVLVDPDDEVLIPTPYWVSYPEQVKLAGGRPVFVPTNESEHFELRASAIESLLSPKTKLLIICNPCNPTGAVYSQQALSEIAQLARNHGFGILSDECYEALVFDENRHVSFPSLGEAIKQQTVMVQTMSKAYAMPGWRLGYAAGPTPVIGAMTKLQSQVTSCPAAVSQRAAEEALRGPQDWVTALVQEFSERRRYMTGRINAIKGFRCLLPSGTFYLFPNISAFLNQSTGANAFKTSRQFANYLLDEAHVAAVPGEEFGSHDHIRMDCAMPINVIAEGLDRVEAAIARLKF